MLKCIIFIEKPQKSPSAGIHLLAISSWKFRYLHLHLLWQRMRFRTQIPL